MKKTISTPEYKILLAILLDAREQLGVSQAQLAERLGVTQSFISKCERGERRLDIVELRAWSEALGTSFPALIARFEQQIHGKT